MASAISHTDRDTDLYAAFHEIFKAEVLKVNIVITVLYTLICYVVFVIILHLPIYKVGILGQLFRYI